MALRGIATRHVVVGVLGGLVLGLGVGPVRAGLTHSDPARAAESSSAASFADGSGTPAAGRRERRTTVGVWDTTGDHARPLPPVKDIPLEKVLRRQPAPDRYVRLTGTFDGDIAERDLPGVGVVVTRRDRQRVAALGAVPPAFDVVQQVRPRVLRKRGLEPSRATRGSLEKVVTREIAPRLTSRAAPVAERVVSDVEGPGLLEPEGSGLGLTERGLAYVVAAHAVPPGSRTVATTTEVAGVSVLSFAHGEGGGAVLVYNPGAKRRLVIDYLVTDTVKRYVLHVAGHSLTTMVVPGPAPADPRH